MKNGTHFESSFPPTAWHDEIARIIALIKEGNSCQIVSLPGVGRSTLLRLLVYNTGVRTKHLGEHQTKFHFVLSNFSELASSPNPSETTRFLFLNLVESLRARRFEEELHEVDKMFQEATSPNDPLVLFAGLKRAVDFLTSEQKLAVIFLFDRFETYVPLLTDSLFANLQALQEHASYRFTVVFSVARPLEEVLDATTFSNFYSFLRGRQVFLRLSDPVGLSFGLSHTEKLAGKKLTDEVKKQIIVLGGGHAKMATVAAQELLARHSGEPATAGESRIRPVPSHIEGSWTSLSTPSSRPRGQDDIRGFLLTNRAVRSVSYEIWETLTPFERKSLLSRHSGEERSDDSRIRPVPSHIEGFWTSQDDMGTSYLQNVGLLKDGKITIPFFAEFVRYRAEHPVKEKITLDSALVDKLTKAEYRLLKFLLENQERIVERDEVIKAVWSDLKSQAGITDQALDQLVLRLRKKIEDDPSNPTHLVTMKGRGFWFVP